MVVYRGVSVEKLSKGGRQNEENGVKKLTLLLCEPRFKVVCYKNP